MAVGDKIGTSEYALDLADEYVYFFRKNFDDEIEYLLWWVNSRFDYFDEKYGKDFLDRPMMLNVNIGIPGATMGINLRRILESYGKNTDYFSESQYKEMFEKIPSFIRKIFIKEKKTITE